MRARKFRHIRIDEEICTLVDKRADEEGFAGNFGSYVETVLKRYGRGLLTDNWRLKDTLKKAVREEVEARISDFQIEPEINHGAEAKRKASNE